MSDFDTSGTFKELVKLQKKNGGAVEVDFRRLVHWVKVGDQLTHLIHPYPAKLIPHIAHFFVRANLAKRGAAILDPFCGSGTVALEASIAGRRALVADSNPLALLIAEVKTWPYDTGRLENQLDVILSKVKRLKSAPEIEVVNAELWYSKESKKSLELLAHAISRLAASDEEINFFRVCLSVTAKRISLADPHISVPVRLKISDRRSVHSNDVVISRLEWLKSVDAFAEFRRVCEGNIWRVHQTNLKYPLRTAAKPVGQDARFLRQMTREVTGRKLSKDSVHLSITSPPYGSAQKYIRASSLCLNWVGLASPGRLAELESVSIGREHVSRSAHMVFSRKLSKEFRDLLTGTESRNPQRARIAELYLHEMHDAVQEMVRVTTDGGRIVLVIGNNQVCGRLMRNDVYLIDVMRRLGLRMELNLIDTIKSRGLMTKRNRTASVISRESVLVFQKG